MKYVSEIVKEKKEKYKGYPPSEKTPESYFEDLIMTRRQTGRTRMLIERFPDHGKYVLMVYKLAWGKDIKKKTEVLRSKEVADNMIIVSYQYKDALRGNSHPVYIDDEVFDVMTMDMFKQVNNFYK